MLLCVSCYMSVPFLPQILAEANACSSQHAFFAIIAFVVGMYASGCFCSWLIQSFRRNTVFQVSALVFGLLQVCFFFLEESVRIIPQDLFTIILHSTLFVAGAAFGLAKRILSCTLLIDKTESRHRTDANNMAIIVSRLALAVGLIIFYLLRDFIPLLWYHAISIGLVLATTFIVFNQKFPFRAPEEDTKIISTDRFFLPQAWKVFVGICCISLSFGLIMPFQTNASFYIFLLLGFFLSVGIQHYQLAKSSKYTFIIGVILVLVASVMLVIPFPQYSLTFIAALIMGLGLGTACSCQLFHILELCNHCQRSTAVSTYFLACDGGVFIGLALSYILALNPQNVTSIIVALCCIAAISCHKWKKTDKNI